MKKRLAILLCIVMCAAALAGCGGGSGSGSSSAAAPAESENAPVETPDDAGIDAAFEAQAEMYDKGEIPAGDGLF